MSKINDLFVGWFNYTDEEYQKILKDSRISLDTNVLLNLFRYSKKNSQETLNLLMSIKERLIFPYYTAYEFVKNRKKVASDSIEEYKKIIFEVNKKYDSLLNELKSISSNKVSTKEKLIQSVEKNRINIIEKLEVEKNKKEDLFKLGLENDICELFGDDIIEQYKDEEFEKIKTEGKRRFKEQIPPGYMDSEKGENGDYYIFKSLIDFSKTNHCDMIFVTDDTKEDMFMEIHGIKYARPELLNEFFLLTGQKLLIVTLQEFLNNKTIFKSDVSESLLDEIKSISIENQSISLRTHSRIRKFLYRAFKYSNITDLRNNVDKVQKSLRTAMRISQGFSELEIITNYDLLISLLVDGEYQKYIDITQPQRERILNLKNNEFEQLNKMYSYVQKNNERSEKIKFIENLILYLDEYIIDDIESRLPIVHLRELRNSYMHGYIDDQRFNLELEKIYNFVAEGDSYVSV